MSAGCVRSVLSGAGYLFTQVTVPRLANGRLDMGLLDYMLQQRVDFVVLLCDSHRLAMRLERAGVPFVSEASKESDTYKMCCGVYVIDMEAAYGQFALCCRKRRDSRALCVAKRPGECADLVAVLGKFGVAAEEWCLYPRRQGSGRLEILRRTAFNAFESRLAEGRGWLPDVICFNDDYMAAGAMASLCAHGVRFPQDVRIATIVNVGNAPVFQGEFDRFEFDQEKCGKMIAEAVLKCLSGNKLPFCLKIQPRFIAPQGIVDS